MDNSSMCFLNHKVGLCINILFKFTVETGAFEIAIDTQSLMCVKK